jgi:hypothetical protein
MKFEFSPQIFEKYSNTEFHENMPNGAELFNADRHYTANSRFSHFRNFANASKRGAGVGVGG